ncbi:MAG: hypothetical protein J3R72DRAFT_438738 [Linnemannia gamsii]|nr:MAG: hypothetical protein J3R72DRAFT_438738 [Linnemannia gamsii]
MCVNKTWRALFAPLVWHQVNSGVFHIYRGSFSRLVIKDYRLAPQDHQRCNHNRRQLSVLSRHSPRIRILTVNPRDLVPPMPEGFFRRTLSTAWRRTLSTVSRRISSTSSSSAATVTNAIAALFSPPTEIQLLSHLVRQCVNLQRLELVYRISTLEELRGYQELISSGLAGTITDLDITLYLCGLRLSISPTLLPQDLTVLQRLRISLETYCSREQNSEDRRLQDKSTLDGAQEAEDEEPLPSLRELDVSFSFRDYTYPQLSHQFLRRCPNLKRLVIASLNGEWLHALRACDNLKSLEVQDVKSVVLPLTAVLKTDLPNLDTITLPYGYLPIDDENVAIMLSACRKGWRSVDIYGVCSLAVDALIEHCCSTLETLRLVLTPHLTSNQMQRILSNCSRLKSFVTLIEGGPLQWEERIEETHILAEDFIDADPSSGSLKPWACEATLQVFRAKISGIPRPDITCTFYGYPLFGRTDNLVLQEAYQGQSQDIQGRVYERLARLTRLQRLDLGYEDRTVSRYIYIIFGPVSRHHSEDPLQQYNCLEMSLRSGLWRLDGLKEMRVLGVERMTTMIGDEEELWMKEHWPKLESVTREFDYEERMKKALE